MVRTSAKLINVIIVFCLIFVFFGSVGWAVPSNGNSAIAPGRLIIKLKSNPDKTQYAAKASSSFGQPAIDAVGRKFGIIGKETLMPGQDSALSQSIGNIFLVNFPKEKNIDEIIAAYRSLPEVEYVEPDYILNLHELPNDPRFSLQWGLNNVGQHYYAVTKTILLNQDTLIIDSGLVDADIDAAEVYENPPDQTQTVVIAIIDTGVDLDNPELVGHIWINSSEIPGDNIDNDHNGYIDDCNGWDFSGDTSVFPPLYDNDPTDEYGHGTHCAGIIAAVSNNAKGIAGIVPDCRIMALKFYPIMLSSLACRAIIYAADNGADVINMSFGAPYFLNAFEDAIAYARSRGVILCASSGNDGLEISNYPAACPGIIAVGATNSRDSIAYFSTFGSHIRIAAPGQDILSLRADLLDMHDNNGVHIIDSNYYIASGTSMAAPFISGIAAYIRSVSPGLVPDAVEQIIVEGADDIMDPGPDIYSGAGRANLFHSLQLTPKTQARIETPMNNQTLTGQIDIVGTADGDPFTEYIVDYGSGNTPDSWTEIMRSSSPVSHNIMATWNMSGLEGRYTIRLRVGPDNAAIVSVNIANSVQAVISYPCQSDTIINISDIIGTASCPDFSHYIVEYSTSEAPSDWHPLASSSLPVNNGALVCWDGSARPAGTYNLRLSVYSNSRLEKYEIVSFYSELLFSSEHAWIHSFNKDLVSTIPSYYDYDIDGIDEIVVGTNHGLKFFELDGTEITPANEALLSYDFRVPIPVGNLDGNGFDDMAAIGVDTAGDARLFISSGIGVFANIPLMFSPALDKYLADEIYFPTLSLHDIDGDGLDEILYFTGNGDNNHFVVFESDGSLKMEMSNARPGLFADINNDGIDEFYTAENRLIQYDLNKNITGTFDLCLGEGGIFTGYDLSAVDIDNDGREELIVMGSIETSANARGNYLIFAFDQNLTLKPGWPHDSEISDYAVPSPPLFGDIDRDGNDEYFISYYGTDRGFINGYRLDGTSYSGSGNSLFISTPDPGCIYRPLLIDLDSDSFPDLLATIGPDIYYVNDIERLMAWNKNGELIHSWPQWPIPTVPYSTPNPGVAWHMPQVGDMDNDGFLDLIATTRANDLIYINLIGSEYDQTTTIAPCWKYDRGFSGIRPIYRTIDHFMIYSTPTNIITGVGDTAWHPIRIENISFEPDSCQIEIEGNIWPSMIWNYPQTTVISKSGIINPEQSYLIWAGVIVPQSEDGNYDSCRVIIRSLVDSSILGEVAIKTISCGPEASIPFIDDFPDSTLNAERWCPNLLVNLESRNIDNFSPPFCVGLNGAPNWEDTLVSRRINLSNYSDLILQYSFRRIIDSNYGGESGILYVEYLDSLGKSQILKAHPAKGAVVPSFQSTIIPLPPDAYHGSFRILFRCFVATNDTTTFWQIGDVSIRPRRYSDFSLTPLESESYICYGDTSKYRLIIRNEGFGPDQYKVSISRSDWPAIIKDEYGWEETSSVGPINGNRSAAVMINIIRPKSATSDDTNFAIIRVNSSFKSADIYITTRNTAYDFYDDFSSDIIEPLNWSLIDNCKLDCSVIYSSSGGCAVKLGGLGDYKQNALMSRIIDITGKSNMILGFSYLRDLGTSELFVGQNLSINYQNRDGVYLPLVSLSSYGPDMIYAKDTFVVLPEDAYSDHFRFYIWSYTSKGKYVSWYLDDIIVAGITETAVDPQERDLLPSSFELAPNYPNPFNAATTIKYSLPCLSSVNISIYNMLGQRVITLVAENQPAGNYRTIWNGNNAAGQPVASGIYFYSLTTEKYRGIRKMVLLK
jgi:subtilisin family serine protease